MKKTEPPSNGNFKFPFQPLTHHCPQIIFVLPRNHVHIHHVAMPQGKYQIFSMMDRSLYTYWLCLLSQSIPYLTVYWLLELFEDTSPKENNSLQKIEVSSLHPLEKRNKLLPRKSYFRLFLFYFLVLLSRNKF